MSNESHATNESLLFKLPNEIRGMIYRYLLGDRYLHMTWMNPCLHCTAKSDTGDINVIVNHLLQYSSHPTTDTRRFAAHQCHQLASLEQLYELSQEPDDFDVSDRFPEIRYRSALNIARKQQFRRKQWLLIRSHFYTHDICNRPCKHWRAGQSNGEACFYQRWPPMDLKLMYTCSRLYHEAKDVLWSTNTFFFNLSELQHWLTTRNITEISRLTKMHLSVDIGSDVTDALLWKHTITPDLARRLSGLRELHVVLSEDCMVPYDEEKNLRRCSAIMKAWTDGFVKARPKLKIRKCTVIIDNGLQRDHENKFISKGLKFDQRMAWAEEITGRLRGLAPFDSEQYH